MSGLHPDLSKIGDVFHTNRQEQANRIRHRQMFNSEPFSILLITKTMVSSDFFPTSLLYWLYNHHLFSAKLHPESKRLSHDTTV